MEGDIFMVDEWAQPTVGDLVLIGGGVQRYAEGIGVLGVVVEIRRGGRLV